MSSPHRTVLADLALKHGWKRGAELGVDKGVLFRTLLNRVPGLYLIGVDTFPIPERRAKVLSGALSFADRCQVLTMTTHQASKQIANGSLDFVFIDADHSEAGAEQDIKDWAPKVRRGGWVGGHDYCRKFPGVIRAVDRAYGKAVQTWPGDIWGVWT